MLDEVTTHLDYHTVTALSEALSTFEGAILLVSHDRFMVRTVVEGQVPEDLDEDETRNVAGEEEDTRRRVVFALRAGRLKTLENGVADFEKSLEKRLAKLAI